MSQEGEFIERVERARPDEFARLMTRPSSEEELALRSYFGDDRYERMHNLALRGARSKTKPQGNVVVLHGIMGAELSLIDRRSRAWHVWVKYHRVLRGYLKYLRLADDGRTEHFSKYDVRPTGMFKKYYGELLLSLARDWNVRAFWYDWRKELNVAAASLRAKLVQWFGKDKPVHLLAHSMGGLVARTFVMEHADVWNRMADPSLKKGGRLIMLGTPNHGSFAVPQIICGLERKVRQLATLDLYHSRPQILEIVNSFPGTYQMLPSLHKLGELTALYDSKTYHHFGVSQVHLDAAKAHYDALDAAGDDPNRLVYIAGGKEVTLSNLENPAEFDKPDAYQTTMAGDCRVTHYLGVLDALLPDRTFKLDVDHGELTTDGRILGTLSSLLRTGETNLPILPRPLSPQDEESDEQQENKRRGILQKRADRENARIAGLQVRQRTRGTPAEEDLDELETSEVPVFDPDQSEFEEVFFRDLIGTGDRREEPEPETEGDMEFDVSLVYGDIGKVDEAQWAGKKPGVPIDAVAVGHYIGVPPQKAEWALERALTRGITGKEPSAGNEGVISQLTNRGTLRGHLGQPFVLPDTRHPGGPGSSGSQRLFVIAGMGYPSRFGTPELTVLARETCWALARLNKKHLASVLIGSGEGNISIADAISAWLDGIHQALCQDDDTGLVRVTFVEFNARRLQEFNDELVRELERRRKRGSYEDRRVTFNFQPWEEDPVKELIETEDELKEQARKQEGEGTTQKRKLDEGFANRVTIEREGDSFWFGALTSDASIPQREIAVSPDLVDDVNDQLVHASELPKQFELGRLFERLIIPRDLRSRLKSAGPLVLQLDSVTARIHWEMMAQPDPLLDDEQDDSTPNVNHAQYFLGTARGLTRQLRTGFAPAPEPLPPRRRMLRVLVVADPAAEAPLPGAEQEGAEVADLFEAFNDIYGDEGDNRVQVTRLFGPRRATPTNVMSHLMLKRYDVLHYAGHCFFDTDNPADSGWVFSKGQILSAYELNRIDRVPHLVFSNACESGITPDRLENRSTAMAPSFAETFFARGVLNFICTAWPVEDEPARVFAREFYGRLIGVKYENDPENGVDQYEKGSPPCCMSEAMREARREILRSGVRTWGAYQHYGNPFSQLFRSWPSPAGTGEPAEAAGKNAARRGRGRKKTAKKTVKKSAKKKPGKKPRS